MSKPTTDRVSTFKSIRKGIFRCYTFGQLETSMLMIDGFTHLYCDGSEESMVLQEELLNLHKEQSKAVTNGISSFQRFLNLFK